MPGANRLPAVSVVPHWASKGIRPLIPPITRPQWKLVIENCWKTDPEERLSFRQLQITFFPDDKAQCNAKWQQVNATGGVTVSSQSVDAVNLVALTSGAQHPSSSIFHDDDDNEVDAWLTRAGLGRIAQEAAWDLEWGELDQYKQMYSDPTIRVRFEERMGLDTSEKLLLQDLLRVTFAKSQPGHQDTESPNELEVQDLARSITPVEAWLKHIGLGEAVAQAASNHHNYCEIEVFEEMMLGSDAEVRFEACVEALELDVAQAQLLRNGLMAIRSDTGKPSGASPGGYY